MTKNELIIRLAERTGYSVAEIIKIVIAAESIIFEEIINNTSTNIFNLGLSTRAMNVLSTLNLTSMEDLVKPGVERKLKYANNCGPKTIKEIKDSLEKYNIVLK